MNCRSNGGPLPVFLRGWLAGCLAGWDRARLGLRCEQSLSWLVCRNRLCETSLASGTLEPTKGTLQSLGRQARRFNPEGNGNVFDRTSSASQSAGGQYFSSPHAVSRGSAISDAEKRQHPCPCPHIEIGGRGGCALLKIRRTPACNTSPGGASFCPSTVTVRNFRREDA